MTELSPAATRLLAVLPPNGAVRTIRWLAYHSSQPDHMARTAARELLPAGLVAIAEGGWSELTTPLRRTPLLLLRRTAP